MGERPEGDTSDLELVEGRLEGLKILLSIPANEKTMTDAELQYAINEIQIILDCMGISAGSRPISHSSVTAPEAPCPQHKIWQHCPVAGEIARKAREDVLDKVITWKRKHGYWFTINGISGEKRYHFEPDRFEEFIKEIRHNAPHTEQEQPQ